MAISNVVDSSRFQIIQSHTNRQRLDEQINRNDEENNSSVKVQQTLSVTPKVQGKEHEDNYAEAREELGYTQKANKSKASAYSSVQNQDRREAISEQLGVSVYA